MEYTMRIDVQAFETGFNKLADEQGSPNLNISYWDALMGAKDFVSPHLTGLEVKTPELIRHMGHQGAQAITEGAPSVLHHPENIKAMQGAGNEMLNAGSSYLSQRQPDAAPSLAEKVWPGVQGSAQNLANSAYQHSPAARGTMDGMALSNPWVVGGAAALSAAGLVGLAHHAAKRKTEAEREERNNRLRQLYGVQPMTAYAEEDLTQLMQNQEVVSYFTNLMDNNKQVE